MRKYFFLLVLFHGYLLSAQDEEIRLKQRAIFIYNFAQQVVWPNDSELDRFNIGVLGDDPVLDELTKMTKERRTIRGRPMSARGIQRLRDIRRYQLVYVNQAYNFEISEVLQQARDQQVLIVSEGYGFNESMINIIQTVDGFQFELNETRLNVEGFLVGDALKQSAITTGERWQELYQESSRSLEQERIRSSEQQEQMSKQNEVIEAQNARINDQLALIDARNLQVEDLQVKIDNQNLEFQDLMAKTEEQEKSFNKREQELLALEDEMEAQISTKQQEIGTLDQQLQQQRNELAAQAGQLKDQEQTLRIQRRELNAQKWFTILFAGLAFLAVLAIFFFWRGYRIKRKANRVLAEKNSAIQLQAKEISQKSREMEQFAYIASHDLQEPLNTLAGSLSLINAEKLDDIGRYSVQFIDEGINRMRRMIQGLLQHSQLGTDVQFDLIDANQVLQNVETDLHQVILEKKAKVKSQNLPIIYGHEVELTLLFQNLINNALKFSKENETPEIHVTVQEEATDSGKFWCFRVQDNGIGIDPVHREKIFGIFQRLHSRSAYEGSGIGLAHCQKIVELHGGRIWVESTLGQGSSFYFTIKQHK